MKQDLENITVLCAHAAWFDASSFRPVISAVSARGGHAEAVQLPLTSFCDDVTALRRALERQRGRVVLVGHSYGGAVITAAGTDPRVVGLVYVAAIVPDAGETVGDVFTRAAPHPNAPRLEPDANGFLWVTAEDFQNAIAQDAGPDEAVLLAATQKPIAAACLGGRMQEPAWREKPSLYLIAEHDRMVAPDTQRFLANRMRSSIVSVASDHTPMAQHADTIAELVAHAAGSVRGGEGFAEDQPISACLTTAAAPAKHARAPMRLS
jgi:pimeloyl-ACP methyl ester carboxylesterase